MGFFNSLSLHHKVLLITGASSGLGKELAILCAQAGARLALFARNAERLQRTAQECGNDALIFAGDVRKDEDCRTAVHNTIAHYGGIDILVNNAGISMCASVRECASLEKFREIIDTNFWGAAQCAHAALDSLRERKGMIVNISSIQGGIGTQRHSVYAAGKHALEGFFDSLALEETDIHILKARLGWMDNTHFNENRIGDKITYHKKGMDIRYCASKLIKAMQRKKHTITLPHKYFILPVMANLFPHATGYSIRKFVAWRHNNLT